MQRFSDQFEQQSLPEPGCRVEVDPEHIRILLDRIGKRGIAEYSVTRHRDPLRSEAGGHSLEHRISAWLNAQGKLTVQIVTAVMTDEGPPQPAAVTRLRWTAAGDVLPEVQERMTQELPTAVAKKEPG